MERWRRAGLPKIGFSYKTDLGLVVRGAEAAAEGGLAVAEDVVREAKARCEVRVLRGSDAGAEG